MARPQTIERSQITRGTHFVAFYWVDSAKTTGQQVHLKSAYALISEFDAATTVDARRAAQLAPSVARRAPAEAEWFRFLISDGPRDVQVLGGSPTYYIDAKSSKTHQHGFVLRNSGLDWHAYRGDRPISSR